MSDIRRQLIDAIKGEIGVALATAVSGDHAGAKSLIYDDGRVSGTLGNPALDSEVASAARELLPSGTLGIHTFPDVDPDTEVYIESYLPPRRLIVVGAVHTAIPLVTFAAALGSRTTVIDPRELFATPERFPHADDLIVAWPDEALNEVPIGPQTDIVMLAHDPKFEDPAMEVALRSRAGYIGAMGSRKTSQERNERLKAAGFSDEQIARVHGPVGLNIGSRTPEEVAVSIIAEIVAVRRGRDPKRSASALQPAKSDQTPS